MPIKKSIWANKKVLITGHTGFKGAWLSLIMTKLGAKVIGTSLKPIGSENLFSKCNLDQLIESNNYIDIRDAKSVNNIFIKEAPEIIFHLAAQAFVREGYRDPLTNWSTNIMGSANIMEAVCNSDSVEAVVFVTSDKCYENREWLWGYREEDRLGGHDPYSASKACSEILASSYRDSFLCNRGVYMATARAGNVVGGGDYSPDRLIPDILRSIKNKSPIIVRNINSIRPWQHVIDALTGYILLGEKLLMKDSKYTRSFNFGPELSDARSVGNVLSYFKNQYKDLSWNMPTSKGVHEANNLLLDSSLAKNLLGWNTKWGFEESINKTIEWHKELDMNPNVAKDISLSQINNHIEIT
jgi:CDP-glucose 4,6-dehydratase